MSEHGILIRVTQPAALTIKSPTGRDLLVFHADGTVTGDVDDAPEAAQVLVREVQTLMGDATTGALIERVRVSEAAAHHAALISNSALSISDALNASYAAGTDPELILWRRLTKVSEEAGEVQNALRGYVGENPRKGFTHSREDLITELLDCAGAALGAVAHLTNDDTGLARLAERLAFVLGRLDPTPGSSDA